MGSVVILILVMEPHIPAFVHHVNAVVVTGIQHSAGAGVVGSADGIEACVLHHPDTAPFGLIIGSGTNDTVVVVDTAATKLGSLAVDIEALVVPADGADTKGSNRLVALCAYLTSVQVGRFGAPQLGIGHHDIRIAAKAFGHNGFAIQNLDLCVINAGMDMNGSRVNRNSMDSHLLGLKTTLRAGPQPDRTVDACAGIPTGIRLILVVTFHTNGIFAVHQQTVGADEEGNIAIGRATGFLAVDGHLGILVNTLKLDDYMILGRLLEGLFVHILTAGEKCLGAATGMAGHTGLMDHGVMGQHNSRTIASPTGIKTNLFHISFPFCSAHPGQQGFPWDGGFVWFCLQR